METEVQIDVRKDVWYVGVATRRGFRWGKTPGGRLANIGKEQRGAVTDCTPGNSALEDGVTRVTPESTRDRKKM
jgi:hypothetical protein